MFVVKSPVVAQYEVVNAQISQYADSALIDILNSQSKRAGAWADVMLSVAKDSDMVHVARCIKSCVRASNGDTHCEHAITRSTQYFNYRKDRTAQTGLAVSYCAQGYFDYEGSSSPNDINFKKAEKLAREIGDTRLEALVLAFRAQLYLRSRRYIEALYCARTLQTMCDEAGYQDLKILAQINVLRIYSDVRMESAVALSANAIKSNPLFKTDPIYSAMFSKVMAVDRTRSGDFGKAGIHSWNAFRVANQYSLSNIERWSRTFIRAVSLYHSGFYDEAEALTDSCSKYIGFVRARVLTPYESAYSLELLKAQIDQAKGRTTAAKKYLDNADIPEGVMEAYDFVSQFYGLEEQNAVSRGDYREARKAVLTTDSISRHMQLRNMRILSKDIWLSTQEDTLVVNKRMAVMESQVKADRRQSIVGGLVMGSLVIALSIICYGIIKLRRKERLAHQNDLKFNEQLAAEIDSSTKLIEDQNILISKRNLDMAASRTYTKRMQRGIWPSPEKLTTMGIPCSFVLRGTTEAISSCFYWYRKVGDIVIVCCADAGFGNSVPGAMLSVVGLTSFNDAVSKMDDFTSAAELLRKVDENFATCLPDKEWRGGISTSVAIVDTAAHTVDVACASANALVFNKGVASSVSDSYGKVGSFSDMQHDVRDHKFNYEKGDSVFLFTKSFVDVTNVSGEHLGSDRLKAIFKRSVKLPPNLYHDAILNEIMFWRSSRPLNDDVLLVGFTLP